MLFGVPGATCDPLFAAAAQASGMQVVVNSSDLEAGYAADGFARMRGLGAVAVTYGVGTMSLLPAIGGAYAERSPVVVINGGPSAEDLRLQKELGTLFSHSIGREKTDLALFREVTEYAGRAEKAADVPRVVDTAIRTALTAQRPVYIEIAKHLWEAKCPAPEGALDVTLAPSGEEGRLATEILEKLRTASRPALLLGIEIQRYGLEDAVTALIEKLQLPWATTMLAKSVIPEQTPGFVGVYGGERAVPSVKKIIEGSDALLAIGCVLGRQYRRLVTDGRDKVTLIANQSVRTGRAPPVKASPVRPRGGAAEPALAAECGAPRANPASGLVVPPAASLTPGGGSGTLGRGAERGLTYDEVLEEVSGVLDESFIAITDTSLSMYPAAELNITGRKGFLCNAVWQAIGYSVGAAVGVALAQDRRPLVICGDGGFQMTAQSLSTMAQRKMRTVVIVLDNGHYGIEQWLLDPRFFRDTAAPLKPYLALNRWSYADLAKSLGFSALQDGGGAPRAPAGPGGREGRHRASLHPCTHPTARRALGSPRGVTGPMTVPTSHLLETPLPAGDRRRGRGRSAPGLRRCLPATCAMERSSRGRISPSCGESSPYVMGIRPHRKGGVRLELEERPIETGAGKKYLIHNYGHGGGGITLSWGCASVVTGMVQTLRARLQQSGQVPSVAVLGTGVIGLTVATELRRRWPALPLSVYAKDLDVRSTTSFVAGGQFEPSGIFSEYKSAEKKRLLALYLRKSRDRIVELQNSGQRLLFGVAERKNYTLDHTIKAMDEFTPRDVVPAYRKGLLPFEKLNTVGREYSNWLINPTILLPKLAADLAQASVKLPAAALRVDAGHPVPVREHPHQLHGLWGEGAGG